MDCGTGMSGSRRSDVVVDVLLLLSRFVAKVCEQKSAAAASEAARVPWRCTLALGICRALSEPLAR